VIKDWNMSSPAKMIDLNKVQVVNILLLPLSLVFYVVSQLRLYCYKLGILKVYHSTIPVIVVGNITVGGSGKTPIVIAICRYFEKQGRRVGVVSRGYGGEYKQDILVVNDTTPALECGDEPALIAHETSATVVVAKNRPLAVQHLAEHNLADIIISDDGMQHYAMGRKVEIAVVDSIGNGLLLPAGPLRELPSRLKSVDIVIENSEESDSKVSSHLLPKQFVNLLTGEVKAADSFKDTRCYGVAGIAKPERFYTMLKSLKIDVVKKPFSDHHPYSEKDLTFEQNYPILMTFKDCVKCKSFASSQMWYLAVNAELSDGFYQQLESKL